MMGQPDPRPSNDDRIRAAIWFAERGFGIFPVWSTDGQGKCRCPKGRECDSPGKHPITVKGFHEATTDPDRIRVFLSAASCPNYGLVPPDGVFILDVDGEDGLRRLAELQDRLGWLPETLRTKTANGWHIFLRWPAGHPRPIGQLWGFVTRWREGTGAGYVIGPRSVHASGAVYAPGPTFEIAELPEPWAVDVVGPEPVAERTGPTVLELGGYTLPEAGYTGSRYGAIVRYVASRYMRGVTREEIWAGVLTVLAPRFAEPLTEPELRSRFDRAWRGTPERLGPPAGAELADEPAPATDRSVPLSSISTDPPAPMLIERLDPLGHTILYGTGGVGKGALACEWVARLVRDGHRVLIVDYEGHPEEWSRRIGSLAPDVHATDAVRHLAPAHPVARAAPEIARTCELYELDYLVIDSAVMGCGADPLKPEAAAAYAAGLVKIGRPALSLAHVTKVDDPRYPFGSVFWHNLARMTWSLTGDEAEILLRHRKHNNYAGLGMFALTVTWLGGQLQEVWEHGYNATILERALFALEDGPLELGELLAAINDGEHKAVDRDTLRRTLAKDMKALLSKVQVTDGKYSRV